MRQHTRNRLVRFKHNGVPLTDIVDVVMVHCKDTEERQLKNARGCQWFLSRAWYAAGKPKITNAFRPVSKGRQIWFGFKAVDPKDAERVRSIVVETDWPRYAKPCAGSQISLCYEDIYQAISDRFAPLL